MMGAWCLVYLKFHQHFTDPTRYEQQIHHLKDELAQNEFKTELLKDQIIEFKMDVAAILPEIVKKAPKGEKSYPLRNLASLVYAKDDEKFKDSAMRRNFESAKKMFREKKYKKASAAFVKFIERNPFSLKIAEAFLLLSESYFQLEDYERCLKTIEKMMELFPASELTGYAMLRMGKIYEIQERPEEAVDIYQTLLLSFPDRGIASQARKSLSSVEL